MRIYGTWFPQEGFDEAQNLLGAESIAACFQGEFSEQIVSIYGFLGKLLSVLPFYLGNGLQEWLDITYPVPLGLILMRLFIATLPNILSIWITIKIAKYLHVNIHYRLLILVLFSIAFKHVETAHYAVNDSLCTFLAILTGYYYVCYRKTKKRKYLIYTALIAALATSTKIHIGLLATATVVLSRLVELIRQKEVFASIFPTLLKEGKTYALVFTSTFIVINLPYLFYWRRWFGEIWYHIVAYPFYFKGSLLTYFYFNPAYGLGFFLLGLAAMGLMVLIRQKEIIRYLPILGFTIFLFFFLGTSRGAIHRWAIPLAPFIILLAARSLLYMMDVFTKQWSRRVAVFSIGILLIGIGFQPFLHEFKLVANLENVHTTYQKLNIVLSTLPAKQVTGRFAETPAIEMDIQELEIVSMQGLTDQGIDYLIFSDFYFPKDKPDHLGFPHIAKTLKVAAWRKLRSQVEVEWELYREIQPHFYTSWSTNIANSPPFYIYQRKKKSHTKH